MDGEKATDPGKFRQLFLALIGKYVGFSGLSGGDARGSRVASRPRGRGSIGTIVF